MCSVCLYVCVCDQTEIGEDDPTKEEEKEDKEKNL